MHLKVFRSWNVYTTAIAAVIGLSGIMLTCAAAPVHAQEKPGVCVLVTMDLNYLRTSYRAELQARIDQILAAKKINHLGVNTGKNTVEVLLADTNDSDKVKAAINEINTPLELYDSNEFEIDNNGDGRLVVQPTQGAYLEAAEAAMAALTSRTKLVSDLKTNGETKITPVSGAAFLVFAPGLKDLDEYRRPFVFTPGVDLTFRLWKQPKEGETAVKHQPGSMQPVRRGFKNRRLVLVPRKAFADGREIVRATPDVVDTRSGLKLLFSGRGAEKLKAATSDNVGDIIVVMLSNIIVAEYKIDRPVTSAKIFVPVEGTENELVRLADKIQSGGYQPEYKIEPSSKCNP